MASANSGLDAPTGEACLGRDRRSRPAEPSTRRCFTGSIQRATVVALVAVIASAALAPTASAICEAQVVFEGRYYFGEPAPGLERGPVIGAGHRPGCEDTVPYMNGKLVEKPPPLPVPVAVRRVRGMSPAQFVAVEGQPDSLYRLGHVIPYWLEDEPSQQYEWRSPLVVVLLGLGLTLVAGVALLAKRRSRPS